MKIRAARPSDSEAIVDLWNAMIRDTLATFTTQEKTSKGIAALISERANAFWTAEDTRGVQGFVTYGPFRAGPGYGATVEHTIILSADAQGQGVGQMLMQQALTGACEQGYHVMVAAISGANPGGITFHKRLGFAQVAFMPQVGRKANRWLDLILMQKIISTP